MPFGAYECLTLPMGVMPASDLFQVMMVHIFADMNKQRPFPYIDDILHFKGDTFEEHLSILDEIMNRLGQHDCRSAPRRVASVNNPWNTSDFFSIGRATNPSHRE